MAQRAIRTTLPDGRTALNNIIDKYTGESIQLVKIDSLPVGITADGIIYFQTNDSTLGVEYWKRSYTGAIKSQWINIDKSGNTDVSGILEQYLSLGNIELEDGGVYKATITIPSGRRLFVNGSATLVAAGPIDRIINQETGSSIHNIIFEGDSVGNGNLEDMAGQGIRIVVKPEGGLTEIVGCQFRNFYGISTTRGWASGIQAISGDYIINIESCIFENISALENGTSGDSQGMARGVYCANVTKGTITNCIFNNIGGVDPDEGWEDSDCIAIQTPNDDNNQPLHTGWSIINNRFLNVKKRAIKLQASGIYVANNYIESSYNIDSDHRTVAAIQNWGVDNKFYSNNIVLVSGTGVVESGQGSQWIGNSIRVSDLTTSYNSIMVVTSTGGSSYPPPEKLNISNNTLYSTEAVYINAGSNIRICENIIEGNVRIQGNTVHTVYVEDNNIKLQSEVTGNRLNGILALIPTTTNDKFFINNNRISGRVSSGVFLGLSSQSASHITRMEVVGNTVTDYSVEKVRVQATDFPENTLIIKHPLGSNDVIARPSTDIFDLNDLYNSTGVNSFNFRNGGSIRATWNVNQFTNAPRQDEGLFHITNVPVGTSDHIQMGIKMNQGAGKNVVTDSYAAFRVYSELGASSSGTTGWSSWFRFLTDDWFSRVLNLSTTSINQTSRSYIKSFSGDSDATINISGNGVNLLRLTNTSTTEPINITLSAVIFNSTGTDTITLEIGETVYCDYIVVDSERLAYVKGWEPFQQAETSTDTATVTDTDAQAVLTELRDLKTKMRAAGLLSE